MTGKMDHYVFRTKEDVEEAIKEIGFLPLFANSIPGFSVEEHTPKDLWFTEEPGPWEWKGPIITESHCAYGKFFRNKAVFISRSWFSDFANVRRDGYDYDSRVDEGLAPHNEQYLYDLIAGRRSILSKEAKIAGGYVKPRTNSKDVWEPRKGFDTLITKLQMECYIITCNFEYEMDKNGNFYGWGLARYTTPEIWLGKRFKDNVYKRTPEESYQKIVKHLRKVTGVSEGEVEYLLMNKG